MAMDKDDIIEQREFHSGKTMDEFQRGYEVTCPYTGFGVRLQDTVKVACWNGDCEGVITGITKQRTGYKVTIIPKKRTNTG